MRRLREFKLTKDSNWEHTDVRVVKLLTSELSILNKSLGYLIEESKVINNNPLEFELNQKRIKNTQYHLDKLKRIRENLAKSSSLEIRDLAKLSILQDVKDIEYGAFVFKIKMMNTKKRKVRDCDTERI